MDKIANAAAQGHDGEDVERRQVEVVVPALDDQEVVGVIKGIC